MAILSGQTGFLVINFILSNIKVNMVFTILYNQMLSDFVIVI